ncbi:hypothetical protein JW964_08360 [candidate division KSB1 bacterium]|nr:hypothetical protein [candidate division KSB1 bacterium]
MSRNKFNSEYQQENLILKKSRLQKLNDDLKAADLILNSISKQHESNLNRQNLLSAG